MATKTVLKAAMLTIMPTESGFVEIKIPSNMHVDDIKKVINHLFIVWAQHIAIPKDDIITVTFTKEDVDKIIGNSDIILTLNELCDIIGNINDYNWINKFLCKIDKPEVKQKIKFIKQNFNQEFNEYLEEHDLLWFKTLINTINI